MVRSALVAAVAAGALGLVGPAGRAQCPSPRVAVQPRRAAQLAEITVTGTHWATGCSDDCGGCGSCGPPGRVANLRVVLIDRSGGRRVLASGLTADKDYRVEVQVTLPQDVAPGPYKVQLVNDRHRADRAARLTIVRA